MGYNPEVILAGRKINDTGNFTIKLFKGMVEKINIKKSKILILGYILKKIVEY